VIVALLRLAMYVDGKLMEVRDGRALLAEIVHRRWHDRWSAIVGQARALLARKPPQR